jgi:hypothetical protein
VGGVAKVSQGRGVDEPDMSPTCGSQMSMKAGLLPARQLGVAGTALLGVNALASLVLLDAVRTRGVGACLPLFAT